MFPDYDLFKWLKDDLGLKHMSESDLNCLIYHPTYGSLCRRFIIFLASSTLCGRKYSDVFATEKYEETTQELKRSTDDLDNLIKQVEQHVKDNQNEERKLSFLKSKLDYLKSVSDLQKTSKEALQAMAERPNIEIEQIARNVEECQYLTRSDLASMYSVSDSLRLDRSIVTRQQVATAQEDLNHLSKNITIMQAAVSKSFSEVIKKLDNTDIAHVQPIKATVDDLIALKVPKFESISVCDTEAKDYAEQYNNMIKKISDLDIEVRELSSRHKTEVDSLMKSVKKRIGRCLSTLDDLEESETMNNDANT